MGSSATGPEPADCLSCPARAISFCNGIQAALLADNRGDVVLADGQAIICDAPATLFNIVSGSVKLVRAMADGRTQILGFRGAGDFLLMREDARGFLALEAIGPARLCRFSWSGLQQLLRDHPDVQAQFLLKMQRQFEETQDHMFLLGRKTARERVASFVLQHGVASNGRSPGRPRERLRVTRMEMADFLGLTVETVSRVLARLSREGIISLGRTHSIHVMDWERLRLTAGV